MLQTAERIPSTTDTLMKQLLSTGFVFLLLLAAFVAPARAQMVEQYPLNLAIDAKPLTVAAGGNVTVSVEAIIDAGWHTYSIYKESESGLQSELAFDAGAFEAVGKVVEPTPHFNAEAKNYEFENSAVFTQVFRAPGDLAPGKYDITAKFKHMVCSESGCLMPTELKATVTVEVTGMGATPPAENAANKTVSANRIVVQPRVATPAPVRAGETMTLAINIKVEDGWHIYGLRQDPDLGVPTTFTFDGPFVAEGAMKEREPHEHVESYGTTLEHEGTVEFVQTFKVPADLKPGDHPLNFELKFQACTREMCEADETVRVETTVAVEAGAPRPEFGGQATADNGTVKPDDDSKHAGGALTETDKIKEAIDKGLLYFILWSFGLGYVALLTPCVYPMVPVTVSFFTKQAHQSRSAMIKLSTVYVLSIILTFTAFGAVVAALMKSTGMAGTDVARNGWINLFIAVLFIFFACSLFGMFDIRLPSGLISKFSSRGAKGGYVGVFFMGLVFTMVSFTCTAAFVAGLIGIAAQGEWFWPVVGLAAFSTALASPFFFLGVFPKFLTSMPGGGHHLHTVKVTVAFVEVIAAYKFLWAADIFWHWEFFTRNHVLASWAVLFAMTGFYLAGMMRMKGDHENEGIGAIRMLISMAFFTMALYLSMGLFQGSRLSPHVEAYLPPPALGAASGGAQGGGHREELPWIHNNPDAVAKAKAEDKLLLYFFTGNPCPNCLWMESGTLMDPKVMAEVNRNYIPAQLFTYGIEDAELEAANREVLKRYYPGDVTAPAFAVVTADGELMNAFPGKMGVEEFLHNMEIGRKAAGK